MRFCLITKTISPHQIPFCEALIRRVGEADFRCVTTEPLSPARLKMGWGDRTPDWIIQACTSVDAARSAARFAEESDLLLTWSRDWDLARRRLAAGRLTFYAFERWFRPPWRRWRLLHPRFARMTRTLCALPESPLFRLLPAGQHAADDMRWLFRTVGRRPAPDQLHWAYLVDPTSPLPQPRTRQGTLQVLWVGRMIACKRVETLVDAVCRLARRGNDIRLTVVGQGPEEAQLRQQAVGGPVEFLPPAALSAVRQHMREADVFVFPSDAREGWGAVVNEAMLEGCALVASRETGAGSVLVLHDRTGQAFTAGQVDQLANCLRRYEQDERFRLRMAQAGQARMLAHWVPAVAAERLVAFTEAALGGVSGPIWNDGLLSPVE